MLPELSTVLLISTLLTGRIYLILSRALETAVIFFSLSIALEAPFYGDLQWAAPDKIKAAL
jgi:hypothetical protein